MEAPNPKIAKFESLLSKFSHIQHVSDLKHLDLDCHITKEAILHDLSIRRDIDEILSLKEVKMAPLIEEEPVASKSKRKRDAFEDPSQPRILNTEERLENLEKSQKKSATKPVLKKTKVTVQAERELGIKLDFDAMDEREKAQNPLIEVIPGLQNETGVSSLYVSENPNVMTYELYLPLSFQSLTLNSSQDMVSLFLTNSKHV